MKTIQITATALIVILMGCSKTNFNSAPEPAFPISGDASGSKLTMNWIVPENFVEEITNQYFPLATGDTHYFHLEAVEYGDTIFEESFIASTTDVKTILGINCKVIHDLVTTDGIVTEYTYDWYVQDILGNVWYFGEDTKKLLDDGTWSTEGSWEAGVDGALPGIIMFSNPADYIGKKVYQELYLGQAEDQAAIVSTNETVVIDYGTFTGCVKTAEWTVLAPGVIGNKYYAPGIGLVFSETVQGGVEHQELVGTN